MSLYAYTGEASGDTAKAISFMMSASTSEHCLAHTRMLATSDALRLKSSSMPLYDEWSLMLRT